MIGSKRQTTHRCKIANVRSGRQNQSLDYRYTSMELAEIGPKGMESIIYFDVME